MKSSFRAWIGFLLQDDLGSGATVSQVTPHTVARFRRWRMSPHTYEVPWGGKLFRNESKGVTAETVQRNIEDLRAALNHAEGEGRIIAPRVPSVDKKLRSPPRDTLLTPAQLGAIMGYAQQDIGAWRWIALMLATASRPGVALAFDPRNQWVDDVIDLQGEGQDRTDKRNAVVPVIAPLIPILEGWRNAPHAVVSSRKRWWRTMRRVLGLSLDVDPYTIRHTVATYMDQEGVPGAELSAIAGHLPSHRGLARTTSRHYLHYNPRNCPKAKRALTKLFTLVQREASRWSADHLRTTPKRGKPIELIESFD
jgi:integrase